MRGKSITNNRWFFLNGALLRTGWRFLSRYVAVFAVTVTAVFLFSDRGDFDSNDFLTTSSNSALDSPQVLTSFSTTTVELANSITAALRIRLPELHAKAREEFVLQVRGPMGPNDGQPLKEDEANFSVFTSYRGAGHLFVTGSQRTANGPQFDVLDYLHFGDESDEFRPAVIDGDGERNPDAPTPTLREIPHFLDLSRYGHGSITVTHYLLDENFRVVGESIWEGKLVYPRIIYHPQEEGRNRLGMLLDFREEDQEYVLVKGNIHEVKELAGQSPDQVGLQTLAKQDRLVIFDDEIPERGWMETSLKMDNLFRIHGLNTVLILWTRHSHLGWSRSRVFVPWDEILRAHEKRVDAAADNARQKGGVAGEEKAYVDDDAAAEAQ